MWHLNPQASGQAPHPQGIMTLVCSRLKTYFIKAQIGLGTVTNEPSWVINQTYATTKSSQFM